MQEMTSRSQVTGSDPEVKSFDRKSPGSACKGPTSQVLSTFKVLQGCNPQEVAITCEEMTSRDLR